MTRAFSIILLLLSAGFESNAAEPLQLEKTIPLPGVEGRMDHMSADVRGNRLFVSALVNKTLEVLDWKSGTRIKSIPGLNEPQGVLFVPSNNRLYVAARGDGTLTILDASKFDVLKTIKLGDNADNVRLEPDREMVWVGYGSGALAAVDLDGNRIADIPLDHHPESFQLARRDSRIFVNVPRSKNVVVIDRTARTVVDKWGTSVDFSNFPMTLDEGSKRLFVVTRVPARVLVYDTDSGHIVSKFNTVGDSDDAFYDAARHRLYVTGGEGSIAVYDQTEPDHYTEVTRIPTAPGARTSFFVPDASRLFVAVPHRGQQGAEIRVYKVDQESR